MKSFLASARAGNVLDRVSRDVDLLEEEWQRHGEVSLERFGRNARPRIQELCSIAWATWLP